MKNDKVLLRLMYSDDGSRNCLTDHSQMRMPARTVLAQDTGKIVMKKLPVPRIRLATV